MDKSFFNGKYKSLIERFKRIRPRVKIFVKLKVVYKALVQILFSLNTISLNYKRDHTLSV